MVAIELDHDQFAWITPLLGDISPECKAASEEYINVLASVLNSTVSERSTLPGLPPQLQMFDANGRLPMEGFLSDTIDLPVDICTILKTNDCLYSIPNSLRFINVKIPFGYANNPGNYEECLSTEGFETRYCAVRYTGLNLENPILNENRNAQKPLDKVIYFLKKYEKLKKVSEGATYKHTIHAFSVKSIENYIEEITNEKITSYKKLQEQMAFFFISIYSAINNPTVGICIPKSCTANDVNINYAVLTNSS